MCHFFSPYICLVVTKLEKKSPFIKEVQSSVGDGHLSYVFGKLPICYTEWPFSWTHGFYQVVILRKFLKLC